jgi:hypothetical protein
MKFLLIFCGLLWILFGSVFLAINASVVHAPAHILTLRNIAYIIIGIYLVVGVYFIKTAYNEKKKIIHKICNNTFYKIMLRSKYKISINEFCSFYEIELNDGVEYINSRLKISAGILEFKENGLIIIKKINNRK